MITGVALTALLVRDYEEAKGFYCGVLGFSVVEDTALPSGKRWVRLRAAGGKGSELLLSRAVDEKQRAAVGNQTGGRVLFFLHTDSFEADVAALRAKGVEFAEAPRREPHGQVAVIKDLYGNRLDLIEPANAPLSFTLRDVASVDLPILHAYHCEEEAIAVSGVDRRDKAVWDARWAELLPDPRVIKKVIVEGGEVVGYIMLFDRDGRRELGYWLGKRFWGRGLATQAVRAFLAEVSERPIWARIAEKHEGSLAVARKCGFEVASRELFQQKQGPAQPGWLLRLR